MSDILLMQAQKETHSDNVCSQVVWAQQEENARIETKGGDGVWMPIMFALNLHHVGYAVREIDSIADVYIKRFGYEACTPVIHDPLQNAFVQFLRLRGDRAYLEFVAPDGPESKLNAATKRGGGLNHLCYTSGPLEETIRRLEDSGMRLISEIKPGIAFRQRRVCWLLGDDPLPIELIERSVDDDLCTPG